MLSLLIRLVVFVIIVLAIAFTTQVLSEKYSKYCFLISFVGGALSANILFSLITYWF